MVLLKKKIFILVIAALMLFSFGMTANAKTLKLALDADPKTLDIQEQL